MDKEIWKDIPSVPQMQASSWGRVKLKDYTKTYADGRTRRYSNMKPRTGVPQHKSTGRKDAPKRLLIYIMGLNKCFNVARLVCEAFHGQHSKEKPIVMHMDENPSNNRPDNLRWGTQKENLAMPEAQKSFRARVGENSCRAIGRRKKEQN